MFQLPSYTASQMSPNVHLLGMSTLKMMVWVLQKQTCLMFSLATTTPSYLWAVGCGLQFSIGLLESPGVGYSGGTGGQYCSRQSWQRHSSPHGTSCSQPARNILLEVASQILGFEPFLGGMRSHYWGRSELDGVVVLLVGHLSLSLPMPCEHCPQSCILSFLYSLLCFSSFIQSHGIYQTQFHCLSG